MSLPVERAAEPRPSTLVAGAVGCAVALGAVSAVAVGVLGDRMSVLVLAPAVVPLAFAAGLRNWRRSLIWLIAYLPFSGIPVLAVYDHRLAKGLAILLKDVIFVLPAYAGYAAECWRERRYPTLSRRAAQLLGLVVLIVLIQVFNPNLANPLVGLIGLKVWLFYVPMLALGRDLARDRRVLGRFLAVACVASVVPALVGIAEAVLVYGGHAGVVYRVYGSAASDVTQGFANIEGVRRIPSTFTFVNQYYMFAAAMVALTYAWWRLGTVRSRWRFVVFAVVLVAAFATGERGAFVFIPVLLVLTLVLEGRRVDRRLVVSLGAVVAVGFALVVVARLSPTGLISNIGAAAAQETRYLLVDGTKRAFDSTIFGLGSGIDTSASRYAYSSAVQFSAVGGRWYEGWYIKAYLELGIIGFLLFFGFVLALLVSAFRIHRELSDPRLRSLSAALLGLLIWVLAYSVKAQYVDLDPLDIYFWLFFGLLLGLPHLDRRSKP